MKRIIVPTDFSENADNALRFAIHIANHFESELFLVHSYVPYSSTGMLMNIREVMKRDAGKALLRQRQKHLDLLLGKTSMHERVIEGPLVDVISRLSGNIGADLVVMGTQGATGLEKIFLGSNAAAVIKNAKIPVLTIPNNYKYRPLNRIVFAVDSLDISDAAVVQSLSQIAQSYHSKVEILHLKSSDFEAGYDPAIDLYLEDVERSFHQYTDETDVYGCINDFVERSQADLLCMVRRKRSFFNTLFHKSTTLKEIFNSKIPLLILHDVSH